MDVSSLTAILVGVIAGLAGILLGFLFGRIGKSHFENENSRLRDEMARLETNMREQTRLLGRAQGEQAAVASLIRQLPTSARELNRSDLDAGRMAQLLFGLAETAFQAEQLLLYLVPNPGEENEPARELVLRDHRGLREVPDALKVVRVGEGKIGWAAERRVDMAADEWLNLSRTEGHAVAENHPGIRHDLIGCLVHYGKKGPNLLGVLCVGLPQTKESRRNRDDKPMLQAITNLGAIALMNTRYVAQLNAKANHDGLTGLLNKRHFMVELGQHILKAERESEPLSTFIFDIDYFKRYNDTNGHLDGDELLRTIARVLRKNVRPGDLVGRYGGEEFLIAMPRTDKQSAMQIAEGIRRAVEEYPFTHGEKQPGGRLTISGGVATFPEDGTDGGQLIRGADQALYQAKSSGRNRVYPYRGIEIGDADSEASMLGSAAATTTLER